MKLLKLSCLLLFIAACSINPKETSQNNTNIPPGSHAREPFGIISADSTGITSTTDSTGITSTSSTGITGTTDTTGVSSTSSTGITSSTGTIGSTSSIGSITTTGVTGCQDFSVDVNISGTVTNAFGAGQPNVVVQDQSGFPSTLTNSFGQYSLDETGTANTCYSTFFTTTICAANQACQSVNVTLNDAGASVSANFVVIGESPVGHLDGIRAWERLAGWAYDPDSFSSIQVQIFSDGNLVGTVTANGANATSNGNGFFFQLSGSLLTAPHQFTAVALDANGDANTPLSGGPVLYTPLPFGHIDAPAYAGPTFSGWALDPLSPNTSITVDFYLDAPLGKGTLIGTTTANSPRSDVNQILNLPGSHGFTFTLQPQYQGAPHVVYAYAHDALGALVTPFFSSTKYTAHQQPIGRVDGIDGLRNLSGWALDPDSQGNFLTVNIYADAPAGTGVFVGSAVANLPRPDVNSTTGYAGNHGFSFALPPSYTTASHKFYVYAVDANGDPTHQLSGSPIQYTYQIGSLVGVQHAMVVGTDRGVPANVRVYDQDAKTILMELAPYKNFGGGVRVALADVNGDGVLDVITGAGPGGLPAVKVFSGVDGSVIRSFNAYNSAFTGGVFVAAGDVDGDGKADIITGADAGGVPIVKVFSGADLHVIHQWMAFIPTFTGGVRVAAADIDGDGKADVIVGAGTGGGPIVKVFSGATGSLIRNFYAFASTFRGGVYVAGGDVNGDGKADIIVGAGPGGGTHIKVISGADGSVLDNYYSYNPAFPGGVRVGVANLNGVTSVLTGLGPLGWPLIKVWNGLSVVDSFFAYPSNFTRGIFVSGH